MRKSSIMLFFLLIFAVLIVPGFADAPPSIPEVHLKAGTVTPSVFLVASSVSFSGRRPYIIHLSGPIEDLWKDELKVLGVSLSRYLPDYAYLAVLDSSQLDSVRGLSFVEGVSSYAASYKIDPSLLNDVASSNEDVFLEVRIFPETDVSEALLEADKAGILFPSFSDGVAALHTSSDNIEKIASLSFVEWVTLRPTYSVLNDQGGLIIGANYTSFTYGLNGSGQTIAIADSGLDTGDVATILRDFWNRTTITNIDCTAYGESCTSPDDDLGHGTHVAGSAVGDGDLSFGQFRGTAFGANLFFQAIGNDKGNGSVYPPLDLHNLFAPAYGNGSRIHSNSWGGSCGGSYSSDSVEVDDYAFNNTDFLILFAGGNTGGGNDDGTGGTLNTVQCPATAKNILSVAATEDNHPDQGAASDNINQVASFSSRGLTDDGRIKPDLAAPGTNVVSTQSTISGIGSCNADFASNTNYSYCSGTSMATPLAAGAAALVRQYYVENQSITPTASLIKASLINGAQDVGYGIPSNQVGWGRINITNSVFPVSPRTIVYQDNVSLSSTGNSTIFNYTVVNNTVELKATLVWTDYPSTASASINLVNNLDLRVTSPNGTLFYGNDFTSPHNDTLDTLNNVEQVILPTPDNGTYLVNVTGQNIPNGPQTFSLVISGGLTGPPKFNNLLPLNDTFFTSLNVSINYTIVDTPDSTVNCSLTLNGVLNQTHTSVVVGALDSFNLNVSEEQHSWNVACNDTTTTTTTETRILTVDATDPVVYLSTPLNNAFSNTTVQFNFTVNDTNINTCTLYGNFTGGFSSNDTETIGASSVVLTSFSNISLPDADYIWNVQCLDKAGRTAFNESNYTIRVDSNPPSLFISHPQNITYADVSNLSFNFSAIDPHLSVRWFGVDAGTNITLLGNTTFALSGDGPHIVFLYANDTILQQNRTSVSFSLDSIVPIVYLESPVNGTNSTSTSVGFSYNVTDTALSNCSLYFDGSLDQTDNSISVNTSQSFSKSFTSSNNGDHLWAVRCIDNAGNSNTTSNYSISLS
ncbi:S8 family serine peptidase, partial [Candidatus Woesearchaeota archaeon]|nr:S8 family serine peptidase [Candidatus Woesearchaeota archaeon]